MKLQKLNGIKKIFSKKISKKYDLKIFEEILGLKNYLITLTKDPLAKKSSLQIIFKYLFHAIKI